MFATMRQAYEARAAAQAARTGPFAEGAAFVGGEFVELAEAKVPLFDLGFLRSDLTYDVPAVWNGRYFRLDDHLARLERSCAKLRLKPPVEQPALREVLVDFWHNHFNVNAVGENLIAVALPTYDRDVIRRHALGNFRAILEAVATSAAMQIYLNNRSSRGCFANHADDNTSVRPSITPAAAVSTSPSPSPATMTGFEAVAVRRMAGACWTP
jgi:hypothetical protein